MGFFSLFATCAICGEEVGLNRYLIGKTTSGKDIWKCPSCTKKGGAIYVDYVTGKATLLTNEETEVRAKCNVCGHVYCYDITDVERNKKNARMATRQRLQARSSSTSPKRRKLSPQYTARAVLPPQRAVPD